MSENPRPRVGTVIVSCATFMAGVLATDEAAVSVAACVRRRERLAGRILRVHVVDGGCELLLGRRLDERSAELVRGELVVALLALLLTGARGRDVFLGERPPD